MINETALITEVRWRFPPERIYRNHVHTEEARLVNQLADALERLLSEREKSKAKIERLQGELAYYKNELAMFKTYRGPKCQQDRDAA